MLLMVSILFLGCTKEDGQDIEDDDFSTYYGGTLIWSPNGMTMGMVSDC